MAFDGTVMTGREEIAAGHRPLFAGIMRGSRLAVVQRTIRFPDPATAIVVQRAGIIMRWQAFQNTRYHPWAKTLMGRLMTRSAT